MTNCQHVRDDPWRPPTSLRPPGWDSLEYKIIEFWLHLFQLKVNGLSLTSELILIRLSSSMQCSQCHHRQGCYQRFLLAKLSNAPLWKVSLYSKLGWKALLFCNLAGLCKIGQIQNAKSTSGRLPPYTAATPSPIPLSTNFHPLSAPPPYFPC